MEHLLFFRKLLIFAAGMLVLTITTGCRNKEPNPQMLDPIFRDLQATLGEYSKVVEETEKAITGLQKDVKTAEPNTKDLHLFRKKLLEAEKKLVLARQMEKYLKIRVERRRVEDLKSYSAAFDHGEEENWPKSGEYSAYLANKKLGSSRKQWDSRVPKLHARLEAYLDSKMKAAAPAAGEGGGEEHH